MRENAGAAAHLRRWMEQVMREKDWNAQEWATKADTSPTNITRFLKGSDHVPSYATLVKLAAAAGVPIPTPGVAARDMPKVRVALLSLAEIAHAGASGLPKLISKARQGIVAEYHGPRAFAVRLESSDYAAMGYQKGDIIVVDPDLMPQPGQFVLCTDGENTGPAEYQSTHVLCRKKLKLEQITIFGVIVELIRIMI